MVLVEIEWSATVAHREYVIQTYSQTANVELSIAAQTPHFDYLAETLKSLAKQKTSRKTYADKGHPEVFRCMSITDSQAEYGYVYYQNDGGRNNGATLKETLVFNKLENFQIVLEDSDRTTRVESNAQPLPVPRKKQEGTKLAASP